jgi:hypothetical protein
LQREAVLPFPSRRRSNYEHIGQVHNAAGEGRDSDIEGYMRARRVPLACRKRVEWAFG